MDVFMTAGDSAAPNSEVYVFADRAAALDVLFKASRLGVALFDDELTFLAVNPALCAINRTTESEQVGRRFTEVFAHDADAQIVAGLMREVLRSGAPKLGVEVRSPSADPSGPPLRAFLCDYHPAPLPSGRLGVLAIVTDVTERTLAADGVARSEARLRHVLDGALAQIVVLDPEGRVTLANAPALASLPPEEVLGAPYEATYWWSDDRAVQARIAAAVATARNGQSVRRRERMRVGPERWREVLLQIVPVHAPGGALESLVASLVDVTEEVEAKERQTLLAAELNHRVKNILAIVRALVTQSARRAPSKEALAASLEGRIGAIARMAASLNRSDWGGLGLRDVHQELNQSWGERVTIDGPNLHLTAKAALAFSMLIYESMSNATKYGALSAPGGVVEVSWRAADGGLSWRWRERGGPPVAPPTETGFGSLLVRSVAEGDLFGALTLRFPPEGFEADLDLALDRVLAPSAMAPGEEAAMLTGDAVLVVEGSAIFGLDLLSVLEAAGARVLGPAATAGDALALIAAGEPPRLAIIAARLAAPELLAALKRLEAGVVMLGGEGPAPQGVVRLAKPYSDAELLRALSECRPDLALARAGASQ